MIARGSPDHVSPCNGLCREMDGALGSFPGGLALIQPRSPDAPLTAREGDLRARVVRIVADEAVIVASRLAERIRCDLSSIVALLHQLRDEGVVSDIAHGDDESSRPWRINHPDWSVV